jgi:imidazolonepropionase-like amidohydrolase
MFCRALVCLCLVFCLAATAASTYLDHGARDPAISPDGSVLAMSLLGHIYLLPAQGGDARQISEGPGWDTHPAFSADGRFLAYAHHLGSGADLLIYNRDTGTASSIYHTAAALRQVAFSPKGDQIFFLLDRDQLDCHLWRIPAEGGPATQVTFTQGWHEWSFALSADGKQVLMDSGRYGGSNLYQLEIESLKNERLTRTPWHQSSVSWSRSGSTVAYIETANGVDSVMVRPAAERTARAVTTSGYSEKQIALSSDGKSAVLCDARKLYRLDIESGKLTPVAFRAEVRLPAQSPADLTIVNARLFDGVKNEATPNSTIEIHGGRISAVRQGEGAAPGSHVIDAGGKFVMSGLMDNHYHYWGAFDGEQLIRNGITAIRDPGVDISNSMDFQEVNALGLRAGPKIYSCGPLVDGIGGYHPMVNVELDRADAAAPLVKALKRQGVDCMKVYFMLPPDILAAVIRAAHAEGLPVTGHIGVRTGWREAMEAGIDGLTHIRVWKDLFPLDKQPQGENESLDGSKNLIARMQVDWTGIDPDGPQAGALVDLMVKHKIGFDPTLALQKLPDSARARVGMEQFTTARETFAKMGKLVVRAQRAGVPLLAGTDDGNLFDEMESYAEAGVPAVEVLRAATINGARWLGKQADFGTVEVGKRGDLIVVAGDPFKSMKELRNITTVVQGGRVVFEK